MFTVREEVAVSASETLKEEEFEADPSLTVTEPSGLTGASLTAVTVMVIVALVDSSSPVDSLAFTTIESEVVSLPSWV